MNTTKHDSYGEQKAIGYCNTIAEYDYDDIRGSNSNNIK